MTYLYMFSQMFLAAACIPSPKNADIVKSTTQIGFCKQVSWSFFLTEALILHCVHCQEDIFSIISMLYFFMSENCAYWRCNAVHSGYLYWSGSL